MAVCHAMLTFVGTSFLDVGTSMACGCNSLQCNLATGCVWHMICCTRTQLTTVIWLQHVGSMHAAVQDLPAKTTKPRLQHVQCRQVMHVIQEHMMWTRLQSAGAVSRANTEYPVNARWQDLPGVWSSIQSRYILCLTGGNRQCLWNFWECWVWLWVAQQPLACECVQLPQPAVHTGCLQYQWLRHAVCVTTAEMLQQALGLLRITSPG